jgi:hypothetical protein
MNDEPWVLRNLRATRASPPGRAAGDDHRRALYGAALEQFEQLLHAAEVVSPAARPLPLFYALSQAGRAIVAAHGDEPDVSGHGLKEDRAQPSPPDLLHRRVKREPARNGMDAFGAVARATGSPELVGGVELGALWASLANTYRIPAESWLPDWRAALQIVDGLTAASDEHKTRVQVLSFAGNPHHDPVETLRPNRYPSLPSATAFALKGQIEAGGWIGVLEWGANNDIDAIAPKNTDDSRWILPALPGHTEALTPLMTWWALLFGLSIFARYHPEMWAEALDVDQSKAAVPLEAILDSALGIMPRLIYNELS